jgi:hypothetical protein
MGVSLMAQSGLNYLIFAMTVIYLGLVILFCLRLRGHHSDVWQSFAGKGIFSSAGPIDSYQFVRAGLYAIFQKEHRTLNDKVATGYVIGIRAMLLMLVPLILVYWSSKPGQT